MQLLLKRSADKLEIQELRVALPGGSRGELQGTIFDTAGQPVVFDGQLALRGTSVARFLGWATGNAMPVEAKADGRVRAACTDNRRQRQGRRPATWSVTCPGPRSAALPTIAGTGRPELAVALEGPQIDARSFVPAGSSLADMFDFLLRGPETKQADAQRQPSARPGWRNAKPTCSLRVSAGQLRNRRTCLS